MGKAPRVRGAIVMFDRKGNELISLIAEVENPVSIQ